MNKRKEEKMLLTIIACSSAIMLSEECDKKRKKRKLWVRDWLLKRDSKGAYRNIINELRLKDLPYYRRYLRMDPDCFNELLTLIGPAITKKKTNMREPITPEEKLSVTLRFLATGETYESLMYKFRIHKTTISQFIPEVCEAIYFYLKDLYLKMPNTEEQWEHIAQETENKWQYPNCVGATDGKHIGMIKPHGTGSEFYNYKHFFSVVLLAFVDYDYKFLYVDVGCQGRISDGGVYKNSSLKRALVNGELNLPPPRPLPSKLNDSWTAEVEKEETPFVFVADDAFPLSENIMKHYSQNKLDDRKRIFNYRLSRFRRVSENIFGIWANRFRVFSTTLLLGPDKVVTITLACVVLHNMLREKSKEFYTPDGFLDSEDDQGNVVNGAWRNDNYTDFVRSLTKGKNNHPSKLASDIRDTFADHFYGDGQVPWQ